MKKRHTHAIVYRGAPYGLDEGGELVSTHPSEGAALAEMGRLQRSPRYRGNVSVVDLDETSHLFGGTAREFFRIPV